MTGTPGPSPAQTPEQQTPEQQTPEHDPGHGPGLDLAAARRTVRQRLALRSRARRLVARGRAEPAPPPAEDAPRREAPSPEVRLLVRSPLLDLDWYAPFVGGTPTRAEAARHYLTTGSAQGLPPHPLFDPETFRAAYGPRRLGDRDPLVAYLRRRAFDVRTHPLFDVEEHLAAYPEAAEHPGGPVAHFCAHGLPAGRPGTAWFDPDGGLLPWLEAQRDAWLERREAAEPLWTDHPPTADATTAVATADAGAPQPPAEATAPVSASVTVVVDARAGTEALARSLASALAQDHPPLEVLVVGPPWVEQPATTDPRVRVLPPSVADAAALQAAADAAQGRWLAWMAGGDVWETDRLTRLVAAAERARTRGDGAGDPVVQDVAEAVHLDGERRWTTRAATGARLRAGARPELGTVLTTTALARTTGFDATLGSAVRHDHVVRLVAAAGDPVFLPRVGVRADLADRVLPPPPLERRWLEPAEVDAWHDVVVGRSLLDWAAAEATEVDPGLVSVVVPTYRDWSMTLHAATSVLEEATRAGDDVEVLLVDNGCGLTAASALAALAEAQPRVRLLTNPTNFGFALGSDVGLAASRGGTVVFLNNDTEVLPGWLRPLVDALADPDVLAVQPLLLYPSGAVQAAGLAFPVGGGLPHELLRGFHAEDAAGVGSLAFSALTGATLVLRRGDAVALRGFDPVFRNGMEDVDLCLRLRCRRPGRMRVLPEARVLHHESRTPTRFEHSLVNRKVFLDRWADRLPADDVRLWAACGYEVHGHDVSVRVGRDPRVWQLAPVLSRSGRAPLEVVEPTPRLRWAIKNPAPWGPTGERWGDTHFARQLAAGLRQLGQDVVIDTRDEFDRSSGRFDDVVLVLRGLTSHQPRWGQVNLLWIISHPERIARREVEHYDRTVAASVAWSRRRSAEWGLRIDPLLQATDPSVFHPDRAEPDTGHRVLFVGSSRKQQRPIVRDAVAAGLSPVVFGEHWAGFIPDQYVAGTFLPNDDVGAAYRAAGFVLNDHWEDMRRDGFLSNRLFDAAAAGARVVTDDVAGLRDVFGASVQVARDADELAALVLSADPDAVFGDDAARRQEAARIHREHSFLARAERLLDLALEVRRERASAALGSSGDGDRGVRGA